MKTEVAIAVLSVIISVLGIGLTLVTGYLAYLALTLEGRLRSSLQTEANDRHRELSDLMDARLSLVDVAVEALCAAGEASSKEGLREELYFLRHIGRLASNDATEIDKALGALEAGGKTTEHLLPLVERVRQKGKWPVESQRRFDALLRQIRTAARTARS